MDLSPALIGIPKRSRNNPSQVARSIEAACHAALGIDVPLPVFHDGRPVAIVRGNARAPFVDVWWCALNSYGAIKDAMQAGRTHSVRWTKTTGGTANNWYDLWPTGTYPAAGTYAGAALTAVQFTDQSTGAMWHGGDVSPSEKRATYLESVSSLTSTTPTLILYDRVLTYEACPISNVNQVFTNGLAAQRYVGVGEPGLKVMVTAQTTLGATANAYTQLQYTDQNGNTLQSMPVTGPINVITSAGAPTATQGARVVSPCVAAGTLAIGPYLPLAAGDTGVRLLDNVTSSAANTGTLAYVLGYPLAMLPIQNGSTPTLAMADQVMQLTSFARVLDGACLALMAHLPSGTSSTYNGRLDVAWG